MQTSGNGKKQGILITPGSKEELFKESFEGLLETISERKTLDALYSKGVYPVITKPSRIVACATLINNKKPKRKKHNIIYTKIS